jgi:sugar phosphate isomerase/epimerase
MKTENHLSRRRFLAATSLAGASLALKGVPGASVASGETPAGAEKKTPIHFFSKPLDGFEVEFMADTLAAAGIEGFDLTVRPGGKVEPARADTELPKFAETVGKHKLAVKMMVTSITGTDTPSAEKVLKAASEIGIRHYRLGYFDYDFKTGIPESLAKHRSSLQALAALNQRYQIQAGYQNHSGARVGSAVWDVAELLRGLPVEQVSSQYDVRHAVCEGAASWVLGMRLLGPQIGSLAIKDFTWEVSDGKARVLSVPLGEGIVDFTAYFKLVKELGITAPLTLHVEYPLLSKTEESLSLLEKQKLIAARLKKDADWLRAQLAKHQL